MIDQPCPGDSRHTCAGRRFEDFLAAVSPASDEATLAISKGVGRVNRLAEPCSLEALIGRVKAHLGLEYGDVVGAQIYRSDGGVPVFSSLARWNALFQNNNY